MAWLARYTHQPTCLRRHTQEEYEWISQWVMGDKVNLKAGYVLQSKLSSLTVQVRS